MQGALAPFREAPTALAVPRTELRRRYESHRNQERVHEQKLTMKTNRKLTMKTNRKAKWPVIRQRTYPSGTVGYQVDLGEIDGGRRRNAFTTREEAEAYAEVARYKRQNEGVLALAMPQEMRIDALRAHDLLSPHGVNITECVKYYLNHVVAYRSAPTVTVIVESLIASVEKNGRRPRTIKDLKDRLNRFAKAFPNARLCDIGVEDITAWTAQEGWTARTAVNYLTKVSQLFNYAICRSWADKNPAESIERPAMDEKEPGILTVEQAGTLLAKANDFGLLPYVAIGLFSGVRSTELLRLDWENIKFEDRSIIIGSRAAKKRSRRVLHIEDALLAWLGTIECKASGPIVNAAKFRDSFDKLRVAAGVKNWPHNALRHSFASYHLAYFGDSRKTADALGHGGTNILHTHYKSLVLKKDAVQFWQLRPEATPVAA